MTNPTIYIIDDDTAMRRAMSRSLRSYGYSVQAYVSAAQFLLHNHIRGPACLVLDPGPSETSGLDVERVLSRKDDYLSVIIASGRSDIETAVRAMKAGAVDFLTKPIDDRRLLSAI